MNAQVLKQTSVIPTPCVPTQKDHMRVDALEATVAMEEAVQVKN